MFDVTKSLVIAPLTLLLALATSPVTGTAPAQIVVNSTADTVANDGLCTLREAITSANSNAASGAAAGECAAGLAGPAVDTIGFSIPGTDTGCTGTPKVCTIKPASNLPQIMEPVFINGYSQPGSSANTLAIGDDAVLAIELDATNIGSSPVLDLYGGGGGASGSTVRGLIINHFSSVGICISCAFGINTANVIVRGNFLGTDRTGTAVAAGGTAISATTSAGAIIGGTAPGDRNVIATNGEAINFNQSSSGLVRGNYIGVNAAGTAALSAFYGVHLIQGSDGNQIGGSAPGAGNVFAGHIAGAIRMDGSDNVVQGNFIGTDATGTAGLGNGYGVGVSGTTGNKIGGTGAGEGNLISGNGGDGIVVIDAPTGVLIQGNKIGTDVSGKLPIPNAGCGVDIFGAGFNPNGTIGGDTAAAANLIAFNVTNGVGFTAQNTGWAIRGNSIHSNGSLGISLNGRCNDLSSSPLPNDDGDADTGANNRQNYPVITTVTISDGGTMAHVSGTLNSLADMAFHVEFFANAGCDNSNPGSGGTHYGEGKIFLGSIDVATTGSNASFGILDLAVPKDRHVITATATDPSSNTSEFSACSSEDTIFSDGFDDD
jgi:CSLREA domain-containing protein